MPTSELFALISIAALIWFWFDSLKAREAAIVAVRSACRTERLQLLDETVAIHKIRLCRTSAGDMSIRRIYEFEYSDTGDNRLKGSVHLLASRVTLIDIGPVLITDPPLAAKGQDPAAD
ncbi:MAG: DUF3301 domain-containing protein [Methylococcaceae bacterium]|nr:DUF3301 domain-containing protein [Methylococcaceae bacterium]